MSAALRKLFAGRKVFREQKLRSKHERIRGDTAGIEQPNLLEGNGAQPSRSQNVAPVRPLNEVEVEAPDSSKDANALLSAKTEPEIVHESEHDEDWDVTSSPVYVALFSPERSAFFRALIAEASLVVIPSKIPHTNSAMENEYWLSLHAFIPSKLLKGEFVSLPMVCSTSSKDAYVSEDEAVGQRSPNDLWSQVAITLMLDESEIIRFQVGLRNPERHSATWRGRPRDTLQRSLQVLSHAVIYRSRPVHSRVQQETPDKAFQVVSRSANLNSKPQRLLVKYVAGEVAPVYASDAEYALDRLIGHSQRSEDDEEGTVTSGKASWTDPLPKSSSCNALGSIKNALVAKTTDQTETSGSQPVIPDHHVSRAQSERYAPVPPLHRHFFADLLFLCEQVSESAAFKQMRSYIAETTHQFCDTFILLPHFDEYNRERMKEGILDRALAMLSGFSDRQKSDASFFDQRSGVVSSVVENVIFGYADHTLRPSVLLRPEIADQNRLLRERVSLHQAYQSGPESFGGPAIPLRHLHQAARRLHTLCVEHSDEWPPHISEHKKAILANPERHLVELKALADLKYSESEGLGCLDSLHSPADSETASGSQEQEMRHLAQSIKTPLQILDELYAIICMVQQAYDVWQRPASTRLLSSPVLPSSRATIPASLETAALTSSTMSTDELIPLLMYIIAQAQGHSLIGLLTYARLFGLQMPSRTLLDVGHAWEWALTSFEVACHQLVADDPPSHSGIISAATPPTSLSRADSQSSRSALNDDLDTAILSGTPHRTSGPSLRYPPSYTPLSPRFSPAAGALSIPMDADIAKIDDFRLPGGMNVNDWQAYLASGPAKTRTAAPSATASRQSSLRSQRQNAVAQTYHRPPSVRPSAAKSGDLVIRPQIHVRARPHARSIASSDGSHDASDLYRRTPSPHHYRSDSIKSTPDHLRIFGPSGQVRPDTAAPSAPSMGRSESEQGRATRSHRAMSSGLIPSARWQQAFRRRSFGSVSMLGIAAEHLSLGGNSGQSPDEVGAQGSETEQATSASPSWISWASPWSQSGPVQLNVPASSEHLGFLSISPGSSGPMPMRNESYNSLALSSLGSSPSHPISESGGATTTSEAGSPPHGKGKSRVREPYPVQMPMEINTAVLGVSAAPDHDVVCDDTGRCVLSHSAWSPLDTQSSAIAQQVQSKDSAAYASSYYTFPSSSTPSSPGYLSPPPQRRRKRSSLLAGSRQSLMGAPVLPTLSATDEVTPTAEFSASTTSSSLSSSQRMSRTPL